MIKHPENSTDCRPEHCVTFPYPKACIRFCAHGKLYRSFMDGNLINIQGLSSDTKATLLAIFKRRKSDSFEDIEKFLNENQVNEILQFFSQKEAQEEDADQDQGQNQFQTSTD